MTGAGNGWRPRPLRVALIAGAAALPVAGVATGILALPVAAAACLVGAVLLPRPRTAQPVVSAPVGAPPGTDFDELDVEAAAKSLLEALQGRVAPEVLEQVGRICQLVVVGLRARTSSESPGTADPDVYRLRQTILSYLPGALDAFLAVPGIYATRSVRGGKSPRQTLDEQLELIEEACRRLTEGMVAVDTDRLEAHGRFLRATLGRSKMDVEAPATAEPTAEREHVR